MRKSMNPAATKTRFALNQASQNRTVHQRRLAAQLRHAQARHARAADHDRRHGIRLSDYCAPAGPSALFDPLYRPRLGG